MVKIKNLGLTTVAGKQFRNIEGGFGEGSKCILAKDIAEIHRRKLGHVNELIVDNLGRFNKDNDIKDILAIGVSDNEIKDYGFSQQSINASKNIYILSERGYAKLLKLMDDDLAWEMYDKLVDEYFSMRSNQFNIPKTFKEALRLALEQQEQLELLELENKVKGQQILEMQPKVNYHDIILQCNELLTVTLIAKDYGMSGKRMNELLYEFKVQYKQSGVWLMYNKYAEFGYTQTKTTSFVKSDGEYGAKVHTYWTQKGRLFLYDLLKQNGILPNIEK